MTAARPGPGPGPWPVPVPADLDPARRPAVEDVLGTSLRRPPDLPVDVSAVVHWCEAHHEGHPRHWPAPGRAPVAPPVMLSALTRPLDWHPDRPDALPSRGSFLHDRLKAAVGLSEGIGRRYEIELHRVVVPGDLLTVTERVVTLGEEHRSRLGRGRDWVVESTTTDGAGGLVGVERWHLLGYEPGPPPPDAATPPPEAQASPSGDDARDEAARDEAARDEAARDEAVVDWTEVLDVDARLVVMGAAANRVWAPQHLDHHAAVAAGARDVFLDTSTQLGLWATMARTHAGDDWVTAASLAMRRPVCPGDRLVVTGSVRPDPTVEGRSTVEVTARVGEVVACRAVLTLDRTPPGAPAASPAPVAPTP